MNFNYRPFAQFALGLFLGWVLFGGGVSPVTVNFITDSGDELTTEFIECLESERKELF